MFVKFGIVVAWLFVLGQNVAAESILMLTPLASFSHKKFLLALAEPLIEKGHKITIVSLHGPQKNSTNVRDIKLANSSMLYELINTAFADKESVMRNLVFITPRLCSETLSQKQVQDLKNEHFDLVILSRFVSDCFLSLVHHFKVPFIYALSSPLYGMFSELAGSIEFPSIVPNHMLESNFPLSFYDRLEATLYDSLMTMKMNYFHYPEMERICRERGLCPDDMPPLTEMRTRASLGIINVIRPLEYPPRPRFPNFIYAGGIHIKPPKPLPKELDEWISSSGEDGVILLVLGSAVTSLMMPERHQKILVSVLGSLKQKVLWKWNEETVEGLSKNVKLSKWLPQQDLLGHPKVKLFITHGGFHSTLEAMYNGVPFIGMPVFADQHGNVRKAELEGWAKMMEWRDLEEKTFRKLIVDTINNKSMYDEAKRRAALMRDVPTQPAEETTFWIEYVMRHKGAPHLMPPTTTMRWYEIYNTDVWGFLAAVVFVLLYLFYCFLRAALRLALNKQTKTIKQD